MNWSTTQDIRDWFPKDIETFAKGHGYSYSRTFETNCRPYKEHQKQRKKITNDRTRTEKI